MITDNAFDRSFDHLRTHLPGLAPAVLTELSLQLTDHLNKRVGTELSAPLSGSRLEEFDRISGDHDAATAWLEQTLPGYRELTRRIVDKTLDETVGAVLASDPEAGRDLDTSTVLVSDWETLVRTLDERYSIDDANDRRVVFDLQLPGRQPLRLGVAHGDWCIEVFCSFAHISDAHLVTASRTALTAGHAGIVSSGDGLIIRFVQPRAGLTVHGIDAAISEVFNTARAVIDDLTTASAAA